MGGSVTGGELTVGRLVRVHRGVGSVGSVVLSISPEERNTHRLADGQTRLPPGVGRARRSDHRCKLPGSRPGAVPISDDLQVLAPPEGSVEATISPAESPATHRLLDTHEISVGLVSSVVDFQAPAPDRTARRSPRRLAYMNRLATTGALLNHRARTTYNIPPSGRVLRSPCEPAMG